MTNKTSDTAKVRKLTNRDCAAIPFKILTPLDARIPSWNLTDLVSRVCPICFSGDIHAQLERPDNLRVSQCAKCCTWYVPNAPSEKQLATFYANYDEVHRRTPKKLGADFIPMVLQELASLSHLKGKRCLDVGFGRGHFLMGAQKQGAKVAGVELDGGMVAYAKETLGIKDIWHGTVFDIPPEEKFDLVLLGDLIEHPMEPRKILEKARDLLNPDGVIVIITPNASTSEKDSDPVTFRVDLEHLQYFTFSTCGYLARELRMEIVHLESYGFPNLFEIDKLPKDALITRFLPRMIGFSLANRVRQWLAMQGIRRGNYHLFCMLKKSNFHRRDPLSA